MSENFEFENEDHLQLKITRFEEMLDKNQVKFFDVDEIGEIIEFYIQHGITDKAQTALNIGYSQHPQSYELKLLSVRICMQTGQYKKGLDLIEELVKLEPSNPDLYSYRAEIYSEMQEFDLAIISFKEALIHTPDEEKPFVYIDIASEYQNKNEFERARHYLRKAILLNPRHDPAYLEYIFTLQIEEKQEDGIEFFKKIIDQDPYNEMAWFYQGLMYHEVELYEKAINAFDYATLIKENFSDAYIQKAECYIALEYYSHAIEPLQQALEFSDFYPTRIHHALGECYENLEKYEKAIEHYKVALSYNEDLADAWLGIGECLGHLNNLNEGFEYVYKAYLLEPENVDIQLVYANFLRELKKFGKAEIIYQKILDNEPNLIDAWLDASHLYYQMDDLEKATEIIYQALKQNPNEPEFLYRIAGYYYFLGYQSDSYRILTDALTANYDLHETFLTTFPELSNDTTIIELIQNYKTNAN